MVWKKSASISQYSLSMPFTVWPLVLAYGDEMGLNVIKSAFFPNKMAYEQGEWFFVRSFLRPGMCFFDIGANQGFYTLLASKCVGRKGKVYAFEPAPSEFRKLKWNVLINRLQNIMMEPLALGCQEGSSVMYLCLNGKGSYSSLRSPSEGRKKLIRVAITTLDAYIQRNNIPSIDFIKIDVEGGELDVLKGGEKMLNELRPIIMAEIADVTTQQWGYKASEIYKFLEVFGYLWFRIGRNGLIKHAELKERYEPDWENLVGVPTEKLNIISNLRSDL